MNRFFRVLAIGLVCVGALAVAGTSPGSRLLGGAGGAAAVAQAAAAPTAQPGPCGGQSRHDLALPRPVLDGTHSVARLLQQRRSVRDFAPAPLTLAQLGQLLWAAQGTSASGNLRTAPSAGALYPLELYVVTGAIQDLPAGIYHYDPQGHCLRFIRPGDERGALAAAAAGQSWLAAAPATVVFGAAHGRIAAKYGSRAARYVAIEVGAAAENLFLQAEDLGLGTVDVGAFDDARVARLLRLSEGVAPLLLMPIGVPR